jgi:alkylation response protein AidB-like acyl-CoA dehydrogenase
MITHEEFARIGAAAFQDGLCTGLVIGLPPVMQYARPDIKERVTHECITGEKIICLAISEPYAGSDVANIQTTATKTPDGKHYIVSGIKKWITNGTFSDYFVTAVCTCVVLVVCSGTDAFVVLHIGTDGR